jgi:hypothetical protein
VQRARPGTRANESFLLSSDNFADFEKPAEGSCRGEVGGDHRIGMGCERAPRRRSVAAPEGRARRRWHGGRSLIRGWTACGAGPPSPAGRAARRPCRAPGTTGRPRRPLRAVSAVPVRSSRARIFRRGPGRAAITLLTCHQPILNGVAGWVASRATQWSVSDETVIPPRRYRSMAGVGGTLGRPNCRPPKGQT